MRPNIKQITAFLIIGLNILEATTWRYDGETRLLYSKSLNGDIQCAAPDNRNCVRGHSYNQIMSYFKNREIRPLECGEMHALAYGTTGYENRAHWCSILSERSAPVDDVVPPTDSGKSARMEGVAYFADEHENKILHINYRDMDLLGTMSVNGEITHHADVVGSMENPKYIMAVPKGSEIVEFYDIETDKLKKTIDLTAAFGSEFKPRSGDAYNEKYNLLFLTAKNRPSGVIIDVNTLNVVAKVGVNKSNSNIRDLGGDQVTGHPIWLDDNHCAILNRADRTVDVYKIESRNGRWSASFASSTPVDTSLHHMLMDRQSGYFYGVSEGNKYIHTPDIQLSNGDENIAEFTVAPNYFPIMDASFPTDAWGGMNFLIVIDENNVKIMGETSVIFTNWDRGYKSRPGRIFGEDDDRPDFQYRPWYENVTIQRQVRHDDIGGKTYRIFSFHLNNIDQYNRYKSIINGFDGEEILRIVRENNLFNDMVIVDNQVKFNNPNSTGVVSNRYSVAMDNSRFNDANLLIGIKDRDFYQNNGENYRYSKVYKFKWEREEERLLIINYKTLQSGNHVGLVGHNMSIDPYGKLIIPVGLTRNTHVSHGIPFGGGVFVVDMENLDIERFIKTGKGAGHVVFDTERGHALVTNHNESYVSMYDYTKNMLIKHIPLKIKMANISSTTQAHSPYIDVDNRYMYNFWTDGGVFFRIDLEKGEVDENNRVEVGGMPIQGSYFEVSSEQKYTPIDNEIITPSKLYSLISGAKYRGKSLDISIKNGAYAQKIRFEQDTKIAVGTRVKITNMATNPVHLDGDVNISLIDRKRVAVFVYNGEIWKMKSLSR